MKKTQTGSFLSIKKPWIGGNGDTVYLGIPANIVKQLHISDSSYLMINLIDESIIVIKKHSPHFTKTELNKIQDYNDNSNNNYEEESIIDGPTIQKEFKNPLDRLDNI